MPEFRHRYGPLRQVRRSVQAHPLDIDRDVIRHRNFDLNQRFLPDGLSRVGELEFLTPRRAAAAQPHPGRTMQHVRSGRALHRRQGARGQLDHWLGDQTSWKPWSVSATDNGSGQELFRRRSGLRGGGNARSYAFLPKAQRVAAAVLGNIHLRRVWPLTCTQSNFPPRPTTGSSIAPETQDRSVVEDVFLYTGARNPARHPPTSVEWRREDARLDPPRSGPGGR